MLKMLYLTWFFFILDFRQQNTLYLFLQLIKTTTSKIGQITELLLGIYFRMLQSACESERFKINVWQMVNILFKKYTFLHSQLLGEQLLYQTCPKTFARTEQNRLLFLFFLWCCPVVLRRSFRWRTFRAKLGLGKLMLKWRSWKWVKKTTVRA